MPKFTLDWWPGTAPLPTPVEADNFEHAYELMHERIPISAHVLNIRSQNERWSFRMTDGRRSFHSYTAIERLCNDYSINAKTWYGNSRYNETEYSLALRTKTLFIRPTRLRNGEGLLRNFSTDIQPHRLELTWREPHRWRQFLTWLEDGETTWNVASDDNGKMYFSFANISPATEAMLLFG